MLIVPRFGRTRAAERRNQAPQGHRAQHTREHRGCCHSGSVDATWSRPSLRPATESPRRGERRRNDLEHAAREVWAPTASAARNSAGPTGRPTVRDTSHTTTVPIEVTTTAIAVRRTTQR